jgi:hypothetical protein
MNREQLEHALRATCQITGERSILVVGSQSILGSFTEDELPDEAIRSAEIDLAFFNDDNGELPNQIDGAAGFDSPFYESFEFYIGAGGARRHDGRGPARTQANAGLACHVPQLTGICFAGIPGRLRCGFNGGDWRGRPS